MIKKTFLLCVFALTFNAISAQENIAKVGFMLGNTGIQYERSLSTHFSLVAQVGLSNMTLSVNDVAEKSTGIGYYFEGRYYFSSVKKLMEGWHIGPYYNSINTKTEDNKKTNISSLGLTAGYQWVFEPGFTLGLIFGGGTINVNSDIEDLELLNEIGFFPNLGLTLGYNF